MIQPVPRRAIARVRKSKRMDQLDDNRSLMGFAQISSKRARRINLEKGVPVYFIKNGAIVEQSDDDSIKEIQALELSTKLKLSELLCRD